MGVSVCVWGGVATVLHKMYAAYYVPPHLNAYFLPCIYFLLVEISSMILQP